MNSSTLVGLLVFAAVLVVLIAVTIQLMMHGWRRRGQRQTELIDILPDTPDEVDSVTIITRGMYVGCTMVPAWNERIAAGNLGYRSKAVLTRYPGVIMLQRIHTRPIWIPQDSVIVIRIERGIVGKVVARNGIFAIRWWLPSDVDIDAGFRANNRDEYSDWLREEVA
ncbi:transporter [Mycobacterium uberis]|uniref:Transporter n=1 Tax=Mycobacterium uberis TaxID=2162698 RepID=A0A3E1HFV5_9MYCO|nr:transporter [Mycobacterium uberis]RFD25154.1 transporter [Mycobacterium uberis]